MAQSVWTGPVVSLGLAAGAIPSNQPVEYSDEIGPSLSWEGLGLVCPGGPGTKDSKGAGSLRSLFMSDTIVAVNSVLATGGTAFTTAANATSGTPLPFVSAFAAGISILTPFMTPSGLQTGVGFDTGFTTGTTSANSPTVTSISDTWRFNPGQYISIGGAGPGGGMYLGVVTAVGSNTLSISPNASSAQTGAPIGPVLGNPNRYGWMPQAYSALQAAGSALLLNPDCGGTRGVGITGVSGGTGGNFLVQGVDIFGQLQSEIVPATAGATTTYGKKTYKGVLSATPQFSDAHNYTAITSDLIGLPVALVNDGYAPTILSAGAAYAGSVLQYADFTNPATSITQDPRGAVQLSTKGPNAGATGAGPNGANRFTISAMLNPAQVIAQSYTALYGVTPA
jgi:hypothetical protein